VKLPIAFYFFIKTAQELITAISYLPV